MRQCQARSTFLHCLVLDLPVQLSSTSVVHLQFTMAILEKRTSLARLLLEHIVMLGCHTKTPGSMIPHGLD
jgi:hypothetical protein